MDVVQRKRGDQRRLARLISGRSSIRETGNLKVGVSCEGSTPSRLRPQSLVHANTQSWCWAEQAGAPRSNAGGPNE